LQPQDQNLTTLFDGKLIYIVPNYQRLYVWNSQDQWQPLWLDIRDIAEALIKGANGSELVDANHDGVEPHFMGTVVLKISGYTPDLARQFRIIDGQQRLTTLQILMASAASALDLVGLAEPARNLRGLTRNTAASQSLKIQYQRHTKCHDYERFPDVMDEMLDGDVSGPLADCRRYFTTEIHEYLNLYKDQIDIAAKALVQTLTLKLRVVAIYLDPHEKEHTIFESLNARGEPLTEWDKIKNYLLYKADREQHLKHETFFEQYLDDFDHPWWRQPTGRGFQRQRADVFVDYWLEAQTGKPVEVRRVFRKFQHYMDQRNNSLEEIMDQLLADALYFRNSETINTEANGREVLFHERRLAMGTGAIWPLLLKLRHLDSDTDDQEKCFEILESYLVRRLISGYQARSYDSVTLELIEALSEPTQTTERPSATIHAHLLRYTENANLWPNDAVIIQAVLQRHLAQYARHLILVALEKELIPPVAGNQKVPTGLHVEHILPQGWSPEEWPLPNGTNQTQAEEERTQSLATLGNMTLLNARLNSSVSNRAWSTKRQKISESDNLLLNKRLLKDFGEQWTEKDIEQRGQWMAEMIVKIWPRA